MRTCQTAANEFLRQFWSSIYPSANEHQLAPATPAQKNAKATRMVGYLVKTPQKVDAIVTAAHRAGVDRSKIIVVSSTFRLCPCGAARCPADNGWLLGSSGDATCVGRRQQGADILEYTQGQMMMHGHLFVRSSSEYALLTYLHAQGFMPMSAMTLKYITHVSSYFEEHGLLREMLRFAKYSAPRVLAIV